MIFLICKIYNQIDFFIIVNDTWANSKINFAYPACKRSHLRWFR